MHTNVTILTTRAVRGALRVHGDVVEGTEVTTYTANLLGKDLVIETRLEFTLAGGCGCDVHGSLSSTKDNVVFYRSESGAVERCVGDVSLQDVKGLDIDELRGLVLGGGDEVCAVW